MEKKDQKEEQQDLNNNNNNNKATQMVFINHKKTQHLNPKHTQLYEFGIQIIQHMIMRNIYLIDMEDADQKTALYYAIDSQVYELVILFVENGSNLYHTNIYKESPLEYAIQKCKLSSPLESEICEYLTETKYNSPFPNASHRPSYNDAYAPQQNNCIQTQSELVNVEMVDYDENQDLKDTQDDTQENRKNDIPPNLLQKTIKYLSEYTGNVEDYSIDINTPNISSPNNNHDCNNHLSQLNTQNNQQIINNQQIHNNQQKQYTQSTKNNQQHVTINSLNNVQSITSFDNDSNTIQSPINNNDIEHNGSQPIKPPYSRKRKRNAIEDNHQIHNNNNIEHINKRQKCHHNNPIIDNTQNRIDNPCTTPSNNNKTTNNNTQNCTTDSCTTKQINI